MKKLNLGSGSDIKEGWVNLDSHHLPGVDVVHVIGKKPLPFKKGEFDYILCQDILEHVDFIPVLKDLHRILAPGGVLKIRVPHFTSRYAYSDPTHIRYFASDTFRFFVKNDAKPYYAERAYYFDFHFSDIQVKITFDKHKVLFYNDLIEKLVNQSRKMQVFYESSFLRMFPAANLEITLKK